MKNILYLFFVVLIITLSCKNGQNVKEKIVLYSGKPLKGIVRIEMEKIRTIDSLSIDELKPPSFGFMTKDFQGNIYIGSNRPETRVYKFGPDGRLLREFLTRGEGPGELRNLYDLHYVDEYIIVHSDRKTVEYDLNGNYISENKFKTSYNNSIYINKDTFVSNYSETNADNKKLIRICSIINKHNENKIARLFDSNRDNVGMTIIKEGDMSFSFTLADITPDYKSIYSQYSGLIYQCLTSEPLLYIKDKNGNLVKTIKRDFKNWVLSKKDKDKIMTSYKRLPGDIKGILRRNLPDKMTAISSIKILPKGYFSVFFNKNFDEHEICIFDKNGNFQYIIEFKDEFEIMLFEFTKKGYSKIKRVSDRDLYVEYQITNLPEIFSN